MMLRSANILGIFLMLSLFLQGCSIPTEHSDVTSVSFNGKIIGSNVSYALVYNDDNNNARLDSWEPRALSDFYGYVSYNPKLAPSVKYCDLPETDSRRVHCLQLNPETPFANIRALKGTNLDTMKPMHGEIASIASIQSGTGENIAIISPMTTVRDSAPNRFIYFANVLGLIPLEAEQDYFDFPTTSNNDQFRLIVASTKVQLVSAILSRVFEEKYNLESSELAPQDLSSISYYLMALDMGTKLAPVSSGGQGWDLSTYLSTGQVMELLYEGVDSSIGQLYPDLIRINSLLDATYVSYLIVTLNNIIDQAFSVGLVDPTTITRQELASRLRALEIYIQMAGVLRFSTTDDMINWRNSVLSILASQYTKPEFYAQFADDAKSDLELTATYFANGLFDTSNIPYNFNVRVPFSDLTNITDGSAGLSNLDGMSLAISRGADSTFESMILSFTETSAVKGAIEISYTPPGIIKPYKLSGTWEKINDYALSLKIEYGFGEAGGFTIKTTHVPVTDPISHSVIIDPGTGLPEYKMFYYLNFGGDESRWGFPLGTTGFFRT